MIKTCSEYNVFIVYTSKKTAFLPKRAYVLFIFYEHRSAVFAARTLFACYQRDARIPTAEKKSHITFCRTATMRGANSRYNAAAKLQIRQNKGAKNPTPPRNSRGIDGGVGMIVAFFMFYVCIIVSLTLLSSILQFQSKSCVIDFPLCYR